ncbi:hypothetical protein DF268_38845 [Streptomyces sp. V2]|nr:hypothetical protein DF268_38845 [Streptomyces sp. V2]
MGALDVAAGVVLVFGALSAVSPPLSQPVRAARASVAVQAMVRVFMVPPRTDGSGGIIGCTRLA